MFLLKMPLLRTTAHTALSRSGRLDSTPVWAGSSLSRDLHPVAGWNYVKAGVGFYRQGQCQGSNRDTRGYQKTHLPHALGPPLVRYGVARFAGIAVTCAYGRCLSSTFGRNGFIATCPALFIIFLYDGPTQLSIRVLPWRSPACRRLRGSTACSNEICACRTFQSQVFPDFRMT